MNIVSLIGARPQFIKAGVISRAIRRYNVRYPKSSITEIVVHTGQHYDLNMSGDFLEEFTIQPAYNLGIQESFHGKMTARMLEGIEKVLIKENPNAVVVYGDTNSSLAGALAAVKLHIPVAHVEAGLRCYNMKMPEEVNRIVTDKLSSWLFCPTETAVKNLEMEGIGGKCDENEKKKTMHQVFLVGDVMFDAFKHFNLSVKPGQRISNLQEVLGGKYYLATVHRSENTDRPKRLFSIIEALEIISEKTPVVIPLHPRTAERMKSLKIRFKKTHAIDPIGYSDMMSLLRSCQGVFTDSGGLQKEAYFMKKFCVTLRDETEWVELSNNGFNILAGAEKENILTAEKKIGLKCVDWDLELYGDGTAGERIVKELIDFFSKNRK